eukprot:GDKI01006221.1.p1 GENE.GDKI01006221.1~~GDKI01006221.1.p1  ORF type:complete len:557 (-),score=187.90 GDKI01006221.1:323-1993(-)
MKLTAALLTCLVAVGAHGANSALRPQAAAPCTVAMTKVVNCKSATCTSGKAVCSACVTGFTLSADKTVCGATNCKTQAANGMCTQCNNGYANDSIGFCKGCGSTSSATIGATSMSVPGIANCAQCTLSTTTPALSCTACNNGWWFNGKTCTGCTDASAIAATQVKNCKTAVCTGDATPECSRCMPNFSLVDGKCIASNCQTPDENGLCTMCNSGYFLDTANGICKGCGDAAALAATSISNCGKAKCSGDDAPECDQCVTGYSWVDGKCSNAYTSPGTVYTFNPHWRLQLPLNNKGQSCGGFCPGCAASQSGGQAQTYGSPVWYLNKNKQIETYVTNTGCTTGGSESARAELRQNYEWYYPDVEMAKMTATLTVKAMPQKANPSCPTCLGTKVAVGQLKNIGSGELMMVFFNAKNTTSAEVFAYVGAPDGAYEAAQEKGINCATKALHPISAAGKQTSIALGEKFTYTVTVQSTKAQTSLNTANITLTVVHKGVTYTDTKTVDDCFYEAGNPVCFKAGNYCATKADDGSTGACQITYDSMPTTSIVFNNGIAPITTN